MELEVNLKNLDALRKINDLSITELMNKLGKNKTTYYSWQKNGRLPSDVAVKLHEIFNVSTDLILDVKPLIIEN